MTNNTHNRDSSQNESASLTDSVGQLVRMAGPRATMRSASLDRMRSELRPLWQSQVERHSPAVPRLRLLTVAAVVAIALAAAFFGRAFLEDETLMFATVARLEGPVTSWNVAGKGSSEFLVLGTALETGRSIGTATASRAALDTVTGHSLRLDHDTRIVLVSEREVRLEQGAVYVESGREGGAGDGRGSGLAILTPFGRVDEIGTQFEVRLSSDTLTVRVREGEVSIDVLPSGGSEEWGIAGEEITVAAGTVRRRSIDSYDAAFDWTNTITPDWSLDGSRLAAFLSWAARQRGHRLVFSDDAVGEAAVTVVLSGEIEGLSPQQALEVVLPAAGLTHRFDDGNLFISRLENWSDSGSRR